MKCRIQSPYHFSVKVRNSFKKKYFRDYTRVLYSRKVHADTMRHWRNICVYFLYLNIIPNDHAFHGFLVGELKLPKELWLFVSPK